MKTKWADRMKNPEYTALLEKALKMAAVCLAEEDRHGLKGEDVTQDAALAAVENVLRAPPRRPKKKVTR